MRILLLSDLHYRSDWYAWVSAQKADLTAIAGDLLDGFHPDGTLPQMMAFKQWSARFRGCLALSSGNHDGNFENGAVRGEFSQPSDSSEALALLSAQHWMDTLERPGVVTDRRSALLETPAGDLVVTTIPFHPGQLGPRVCDELWKSGYRLKAQHGVPWLVLHHEPPADTLVGGMTGDPSLFYKIRECQPDFVLSGHIHGQPYAGSFADHIGRTWCFNPGVPVVSRALKAKVPNHIILDLTTHAATWHATPNVGREPISELKHLE